MATQAKGAAKKKPAKRKPAKKKATPKRVVDELRQAEGLIEAELERPQSAASEATLTSVSAAPETILSRSGGGVRNKDITGFLRQLIMLLDAGTPILKSLKTLSRRGERKGLRDMVSGITEYVEAGNPLWQAFAREGKHFLPVEVNLIKASEASGTLTTVLKRISDYREQRDRLRKFMQVAMIYPAVLVSVSLGLIIILALFVIPAFKEIFEQMGAEIGGFSGFVMGTADVIAGYWWVLVGAIVGFFAGYYLWWVRSPLRMLASDQAKLRLPIFGSIIQRYVVADFTRTFAMLLRSGISMMATLDLCKNSVGNRAYVSVIQDMRDSVEAGEGLESPLRQAEKKGYLPGVVVDMLLTGEESGSIDRVADQIADTYEDEVEIAVSGLKEAITPVFVVGMGFVVGCLVLAMFLPLISMIDTIAGGGL